MSQSSIIPLHYYIAFNKPKEAVQVMEDFGYTVQVRDKSGVASTLAQFIDREGENAIQALAKIHPDRELILSTGSSKLSADGFSDIEKVASQAPSNASFNPASFEQKQTADYTPVIMAGVIASALFISAAIITTTFAVINARKQ